MCQIHLPKYNTVERIKRKLNITMNSKKRKVKKVNLQSVTRRILSVEKEEITTHNLMTLNYAKLI